MNSTFYLNKHTRRSYSLTDLSTASGQCDCSSHKCASVVIENTVLANTSFSTAIDTSLQDSFTSLDSSTVVNTMSVPPTMDDFKAEIGKMFDAMKQTLLNETGALKKGQDEIQDRLTNASARIEANTKEIKAMKVQVDEIPGIKKHLNKLDKVVESLCSKKPCKKKRVQSTESDKNLALNNNNNNHGSNGHNEVCAVSTCNSSASALNNTNHRKPGDEVGIGAKKKNVHSKNLMTVNSNPVNNHSAPSPSTNRRTSFGTMAAEIHRREVKSLNILMYNVPLESVGLIESVRSIFTKIDGIDWNLVHVRRFKKPSAQSVIPPVLVTFGSKFEASHVLANWKMIDPKIKVAADFTPTQAEQYKKLKALANKYNATNSSSIKIVKILDGEPTLIKIKSTNIDSALPTAILDGIQNAKNTMDSSPVDVDASNSVSNSAIPSSEAASGLFSMNNNLSSDVDGAVGGNQLGSSKNLTTA